MDAIVNGTVKEVVVFIKDTATTESYTYVHTLSLHDALPIFYHSLPAIQRLAPDVQERCLADPDADRILEAQTCQINPQVHIDRQVLETGDDPPDPLARAPRERNHDILDIMDPDEVDEFIQISLDRVAWSGGFDIRGAVVEYAQDVVPRLRSRLQVAVEVSRLLAKSDQHNSPAHLSRDRRSSNHAVDCEAVENQKHRTTGGRNTTPRCDTLIQETREVARTKYQRGNPQTRRDEGSQVRLRRSKHLRLVDTLDFESQDDQNSEGKKCYGVLLASVGHRAGNKTMHARRDCEHGECVHHRHQAQQQPMQRDRFRVFPCSGWLTERIQRSEEHTYELQSLMRISYAVFCLNNK